MPPRFTRHCEQRMAQRGVSEEDVTSALARQINTTPGEPGTLWIRGYAAGGRVLKVCVDAADRDAVITVAWPGHEG